jgi:hypothetical protein
LNRLPVLVVHPNLLFALPDLLVIPSSLNNYARKRSEITVNRGVC